MTSEGPLRLQVDRGVAELVLNRPERRNAVDKRLAGELERTVDALGKRSDVGAVLIYGAGATFSSGGDLRALEAMGDEEALALMAQMTRTLGVLSRLPMAVLAWIEGDAVGGGLEIALSADVILAHPEARLNPVQVSLGLLPGWGGWARLTERLGAARARALLIEASPLGAEKALVAGLVDRILPDLSAARVEARTVAAHPQAAVRAVKTGEPSESHRAFADLWRDPNRRLRLGRRLKGG